MGGTVISMKWEMTPTKWDDDGDSDGDDIWDSDDEEW